ncbi:MAG: metalloregulator ArsR/SmtB family transcription factor [Alphaproteobacteria bacterium]|nr:metalloregulator ArsR/SmtB family transcription factor [Alphaproteobacteria bacterium]
MESLMSGLRAAAEPTRLRLLALCAHGELTVTELTQILGQSQPRVSRHLKLLCESGLLVRFREGTSAFYRLAEQGANGDLARTLVDLIPADDPTLSRDLERLEAVKLNRAEAAAAYFRANAARWNQIRSLYVAESAVEAAVLELLGEDALDDLLDIGTGTGRLLEILAPRIRRGVGIDLSREMLAFARSALEKVEARHCQVRHADMYSLPFASGSFDAVTIHQVLHFAEEPEVAVAEAARVLRPGGRLVLVDFLPHELEFLRAEHQHRRLGFAAEEVGRWFAQARLAEERHLALKGDPLTVGLWLARHEKV